MKKITLITFGLSLFLLQFCTTGSMATKSAVEQQKTPVSYEKDIFPILKDRCAPCHFSPDGKKEHLDTYDASVEYIDDIIEYIQLPKDQKKFMPYKSKKEPLSDSLITVFKLWKSQGLAK